jgi:hypothetical protein
MLLLVRATKPILVTALHWQPSRHARPFLRRPITHSILGTDWSTYQAGFDGCLETWI